MDLNRVTLIGRVTHAPESKAQPSGKTMTTFRLATSVRWNDVTTDGEVRREAIEFHDVETWGKLAEIIARYVRAGSKVYVEGRLRSQSRKARHGSHVEIVADNLIMLGHRPSGQIP
jgi:single-strand DNA-binding protein